MNGTSMATPIASGASAMVLSLLGASDGNYFKAEQVQSEQGGGGRGRGGGRLADGDGQPSGMLKTILWILADLDGSWWILADLGVSGDQGLVRNFLSLIHPSPTSFRRQRTCS